MEYKGYKLSYDLIFKNVKNYWNSKGTYYNINDLDIESNDS